MSTKSMDEHESSVWRGIAFGLAATLMLLLAIGIVAKAMRAKAAEAEMRAEQRDLMEKAEQK